MKVLTLTEPYASLMALEEKLWETRSWKLPAAIIGQNVAIHAAKGYPGWAMRTTEREPFCSSLRAKGNVFVPNLTRGKILCIVKFLECRKVSELTAEQISKKECAFGDYSPGRFAFRAEFVGRLFEPVAVKGHLGFWDWWPQEKYPWDVE